MTASMMNARSHLKVLGLAALLLGAVACTPASSGSETGAGDNLTVPSTNAAGLAFGAACAATDECAAGLTCLTDLPTRPFCGCPLMGWLSGTTCVPASVTGVVSASVSFRYADVALLMQDPLLPAGADGVPVASYSVVAEKVSNLSGEFAFFDSLDDGIYMVSASLRTGERAQTEPLTLGELTFGMLTLTVK